MEHGSQAVPVVAWRGASFAAERRSVPLETAVAITVNGSTHAVMMATPEHLESLAVGLALNERIVGSAGEIESLEVLWDEAGAECRLWIGAGASSRYVARRRQMTGPVGCGLCGVESLELARPELPPVDAALRVAPGAIGAAMAGMQQRQSLGRRTRAVHAAGFCAPDGTCRAAFEDVGRHNALDKLAGFLAAGGIAPASGFVTITSRVSVELIQKCAVMGCGMIAAVSVPTALAIEAADRTGITLVAVSRGEEFEIFTHAGRVLGAPVADRPLGENA